MDDGPGAMPECVVKLVAESADGRTIFEAEGDHAILATPTGITDVCYSVQAGLVEIVYVQESRSMPPNWTYFKDYRGPAS